MPHAPAGLDVVEHLFARRNFRLLKPQCQTLLADASNLAPEQHARLEYMLGCIHEHELSLEEALQSHLRSEQLYLDCGMEREALKARLGITIARRAGLPLDAIYREALRYRDQARERGWDEEHAEALTVMATVCRQRKDYEGMLVLTEQALALLDPQSQPFQFYRPATLRAWALHGAGRRAEGEAIAQTAFELLGGLENPGLLRRELGHLAYQAWCSGDISRARALTEQQLQSALTDGTGLEVAMSRYNLGLFAAADQDWENSYKLALVAWQQRLAPQGLVLESAVLRLLCLSSLHLARASDALNYIRIAQRQLTDKSSDEGALVEYYLALALLASAEAQQARQIWIQRASLGFGVENRIEVNWMLRLLECLRGPLYAQQLDLALKEQAAAMALDLNHWLALLDKALTES